MQGAGALAMWWDVAPDARADFEHWHTHEHFPERLGIPGFWRASRWRDARGGEGIFVVYELEAYETLASPRYLERLNTPTPWSTRMMLHHRNMVRSQCRVVDSQGGAVARHALTVRLSPRAGSGGAGLRCGLQALISDLPARAGLGGAHLLVHEAPPIAATTEQKIRGGDAFADWVLLVMGYDLDVVDALARHELAEASLVTLGATPGSTAGLYTLAYSATPTDVA
jgi:hypothetical protein